MRHDYLDEHQNVAVDALEELKRICDKYDIRFYLMAGTTLGAVRHKGMIPWDDDIDTGFLLEDLEKLKTVIREELPPCFEYVSCDTENGFPRLFGKILYDRRCCVDLFVIARWTSNNLRGYIRWYINRLAIEGYYHSIGYSKSKSADKEKRRFTFLSIRRKITKFSRILLCKMLWFVKPEQFIGLARKNEHHFDSNGDCYVNLYSIYGMKKERLLSSWVEKPSFVTFEGKEYQTMGHVDEYLTHLYGDYMQLPPEEKRIRSVHEEVYPVKK